MIKIKPIFLTLSVLLAAGTTQAQSIGTDQLSGYDPATSINTVTTAVPFLMISPDARSGALGDAGAALSPDANSIHWNMAKLAFVKKKAGFSVSYTPWLRALVPDINLAYLSFYNKLKGDQAISASLRYFSLGDITFTDIVGNTIGQFKPNEFALDLGYARKFSDRWSGGLALRYIYSNLTGGISLYDGQGTKAGQSVAADISVYYRNDELEVGGKDAEYSTGITFSNIGAKISYTESGRRDFIPINLRWGNQFKINLDDYNSLAFLVDFNKLMVPTPPIYAVDDSTGQPIKDQNDNFVIAKGQDPNRGLVNGMFTSFADAPGGFREELKEINYSIGIEYWYDNQFAVRAGYFHEPRTKGNRQYFTLGAGLRYSVFGLDFAYLIATQQRNPLENTLRFTLHFDFDSFKAQNKDND
ncbi:MAG: type IX secretion system outer membrane channel protein PorV [Sphingobacteriales bacterium JAD_PAG50586_3]|nr:MAG: type IX secretion system outer membrane channel protein PorV [Sphingobacteriales bacterium JAD_PAG50586_3]